VTIGEAEPHLLDTSAVVKLIRAGSKALPNACVSYVTIGELRFGAEHSDNPLREHGRIDAAIGTARVLQLSHQTLLQYASICAKLARDGKRMRDNDIWTAAIAMEFGLPLYAHDKHFEWIEGLTYVRC
jgi:tRNA(fMet)-specific endonuclease VapC